MKKAKAASIDLEILQREGVSLVTNKQRYAVSRSEIHPMCELHLLLLSPPNSIGPDTAHRRTCETHALSCAI